MLWTDLARSPILWIIGFITAGNALLQTLLFYRKTRETAQKIGMKRKILTDVIKTSVISSIGPSLGIFVGMFILVIAMGGAVAFIRESAGVGSIMFELYAAMMGAMAAGATLTAEGMTVEGFQAVLWTMATCSVGWVIVGGIATRWLPKMRDKMGGGDPKMIGLITMAMMLGAFGKMITTESIIPMIAGKYAPITAMIVGFIVAMGWLRLADKLDKPTLKQYFLLVSLIMGMAVAQLLFGGA